MASFKSLPCWRNGTIEWGSWRTASKLVRIIETWSVADIVGKGLLSGKNLRRATPGGRLFSLEVTRVRT